MHSLLLLLLIILLCIALKVRDVHILIQRLSLSVIATSVKIFYFWLCLRRISASFAIFCEEVLSCCSFEAEVIFGNSYCPEGAGYLAFFHWDEQFWPPCWGNNSLWGRRQTSWLKPGSYFWRRRAADSRRHTFWRIRISDWFILRRLTPTICRSGVFG